MSEIHWTSFLEPGHGLRRPGPSFPKRRKLDKGVILAPRTPSPISILFPHPASSSLEKQPEFVPVKPAASTLLSKLAHVNRQPFDKVEPEPLIRSSAFTDTPRDPSVSSSTVPQRDDRLAIVETLDVGPVDHKPPFDDPYFQQLEPNSGIRLSCIACWYPHEDIQDHLRGRYYLSPSRLYSAVAFSRTSKDMTSPSRATGSPSRSWLRRGPLQIQQGAGGDHPGRGRPQGKGQSAAQNRAGKKFINIKLVDFWCAPRALRRLPPAGKLSSEATRCCPLLLFESDGFETVPQEEGQPKKVYRGGSRGAFEQMCDLKEGDVRSNDTPHPTTNVLAITPESASSILVIGRAKDLGLCVAVKRDGKVCKSWCDTRVSDVCEWHLQHAVEQRRANRPEVYCRTSGMSMTAGKRKADYDPRRKWGLKPLDESSGATYLVSGHIIHAGRVDPRDSLFVSENIGREGQAKAARKPCGKGGRADTQGAAGARCGGHEGRHEGEGGRVGGEGEGEVTVVDEGGSRNRSRMPARHQLLRHRTLLRLKRCRSRARSPPRR
ncbi:hypothetical protein B0H14DRAFT_3114040 [Mycena olivaceomarginata]|nr:hypothetical protein B0H14DRAFT_3114040 [Mycena olivaceomarginata]